ncbi:MAG: AAA family ATPase [Gemmatimonadaceae bacterium]|nr:AAA family ATPase [Gemmatimonadaceae bacterium]
MTSVVGAIEPKGSLAADDALQRRQKTVTSRTAMDVKPRQVEWLLPGLIPFGAITVLSGQPGLGKSLLTVKIAADFSAGRLDQRGDVLMLTAEDPTAEVVVPRLMAARAKLTSIHFAEFEDRGLSIPMRFPTDTGSLHKLVQQHDVRLVVIDPLTAHLAGGVDSFKDQSIREALAPMAALAEEQRIAIIVVAHLNKGQSSDPVQRLGGSIGLPAAARSVLLLGRDPDDPEGSRGARRVLAHVKSNFDRQASSRAFRIIPAVAEDWLGTHPTAEIVEIGPSPYQGSDLLQNQAEADLPEVMNEAVAFLRSALEDGPRPARDVQAAAEQAALSWDTVKRAKTLAGVKTRKQRDVSNGPWVWELAEVQRVELPGA